MNNRKYFIAAITAFVIWGFFVIELRVLKAYSAGQILYFRILISCIALIILAFIRKSVTIQNYKTFMQLESKQKGKLVFITLLGGAFLTANWLLFIYVINHISIKTASFSYFICPVLTAIFAYILIKENLTKIQWIAVTICVLSCVLIGFQSSTELFYSFVIASTYALYLITQRRNLVFDRLLVLTIQIAFSLVFLSPFYNVLVVEAPLDAGFYLHILFIAVVFTILPLFLNLYALKGLPSATIGIMMYLNPMIGFAIAFMYYKEQTGLLQVIGYILILIAIVVFNFKAIFTNKTSSFQNQATSSKATSRKF